MHDERSDEQLLLAFGKGEDAAFTPLVHRHGAAVKAFALRMLRSPDQAEDIYAETFLRLASGKWAPTGSARGYIFTIARRLCLDVLRQRRTAHAAVPHLIELDWGSPSPSPEARASLNADAARLEAALSRLSEEHREVLLLRVVHGLSAAEVAAALDLDEAQVHSKVSYARKRLRAVLESMATPNPRSAHEQR